MYTSPLIAKPFVVSMCSAEIPLLEIANHTNIFGANFRLDLNFTSDDVRSLSQDPNPRFAGHIITRK